MNYYNMQGPAQYTQHQQSRRDRQMGNLLQMMMQMKQFKQREGQWEQGQALEREQFELSKKRQAATEKYNEYLMKPKPPTATSAMKTIKYMVAVGIAPNEKVAFDMYKGFKTPERIKMEAAAKAEGAGTGRFKKETPPKLTTYDKKKIRYDQLLADKKITQEQYDKGLLGITPPTTKEDILRKGYPARASNEKFVKDTRDAVDNLEAEARGQVKKLPGSVPIVEGIRIDMPYHYCVAKMNIEDGVATVKDEKTARKYDRMFQAFKDKILPAYSNFKEFINDKSRGADWDVIQVRTWFKIYK